MFGFTHHSAPYNSPVSHQGANLKIDEDKVQSRKWSLIVSNKTIASYTFETADGRCQRPLHWKTPRGFCRTLAPSIIKLLSDLSPYAPFFFLFFPFGGDRENQYHWIPQQKLVNISIQVLNINNGYKKTCSRDFKKDENYKDTEQRGVGSFIKGRKWRNSSGKLWKDPKFRTNQKCVQGIRQKFLLFFSSGHNMFTLKQASRSITYISGPTQFLNVPTLSQWPFAGQSHQHILTALV